MFTAFALTLFSTFTIALKSPNFVDLSIPPVVTQRVLAQRQFSLENRYAVASVNEVFKKNILLNLAYLNKTVIQKKDIDWNRIEQSTNFSFTLKPGEVFAYHDHVLPEYNGKVAVTTNAHFASQEGFVSDGYLFGDGVCHLASLMNWAAQDAGLEVLVTKNHNFAAIPDVPKQYGVSIYTNVADKNSGTRNNLYITNNRNHDVVFHFEYTEDLTLNVFVTEDTASSRVMIAQTLF